MTDKITFIGDVHGKLMQYLEIISKNSNTVQIGDFGFGFGTTGDAKFIDKMIKNIDTSPGMHRIMRGNHDSPEEAKKSENYIDDGALSRVGEFTIYYVGGAYSIDQHLRTEGVDWWRDEEISYERLHELIDHYAALCPDIMVTHDCPESIAKDYMLPHVGSTKLYPNRTAQALENMFQLHQPKVWIFGHWHESFDRVINGTRFKCLEELETFDVEFGKIKNEK